MSNSGRIHLHRCPECRTEERCGDYQCYRTGYAYSRLCGKRRCVQRDEAAAREAKRERETPDAPSLFPEEEEKKP